MAPVIICTGLVEKLTDSPQIRQQVNVIKLLWHWWQRDGRLRFIDFERNFVLGVSSVRPELIIGLLPLALLSTSVESPYRDPSSLLAMPV